MIQRSLTVITMLCVGLFLLAGCYGQDSPSTGAGLISGMDTCSKPITTDSPQAQQWFDQGLLCLYGFTHDEATRQQE